MIDCDNKNAVCGFECTGSDESDTWKKLHDLPRQMKCGTCASHADFLFKGVHDHVNTGLGKKAHNPKVYRSFVKEIQCTYSSCVKKGECEPL